MICSTLLPLTPKSLPPFGGQTQPAHVLLKFADSRRALLTVQRHGFMVAPDACGRSGCSLEYAVRVVDHFEFRARVFGLSQAGLMEADVTVETLGVVLNPATHKASRSLPMARWPASTKARPTP